MTRMFNPPHPASILREDVLPDLGLTVTEAARQLGVSRVQLSRVLNERAAITPDMALRLEQWISGLKAETWLRLQADYALWQAEQKGRPQVEPAHPAR
jgi:addiction module HigA family antidote